MKYLLALSLVSCGQGVLLDDRSFSISNRHPEFDSILYKIVDDFNNRLGKDLINLTNEPTTRGQSSISFVDELPDDTTIGLAAYGNHEESLIGYLKNNNTCTAQFRLKFFQGATYEQQYQVFVHEVYGHCLSFGHVDIINDPMNPEAQKDPNYNRLLKEILNKY